MLYDGLGPMLSWGEVGYCERGVRVVLWMLCRLVVALTVFIWGPFWLLGYLADRLEVEL